MSPCREPAPGPQPGQALLRRVRHLPERAHHGGQLQLPRGDGGSGRYFHQTAPTNITQSFPLVSTSRVNDESHLSGLCAVQHVGLGFLLILLLEHSELTGTF